jgi:hypothetical protein
LAKGKHILRPIGVNHPNCEKVKKASEKDMPVSEIVNLTGNSYFLGKTIQK